MTKLKPLKLFFAAEHIKNQIYINDLWVVNFTGLLAKPDDITCVVFRD